MVGTIVSIGYGEAGHRGRGPLAAHLVGTILGGLTLGAAIALIGDVGPSGLPRWQLAAGIGAVVAAAYGLRELDVIRVPYPQRQWQVPRAWSLVMKPNAYAGMYGFLLGLSFLVRMHVATMFVVAVIAILSGSAPLAILTGLGYGIGRGGALVVLRAGGRWAGWSRPRDLFEALERYQRVVHPANGVALLFSTAIFFGSALRAA